VDHTSKPGSAVKAIGQDRVTERPAEGDGVGGIGGGSSGKNVSSVVRVGAPGGHVVLEPDEAALALAVPHVRRDKHCRELGSVDLYDIKTNHAGKKGE